MRRMVLALVLVAALAAPLAAQDEGPVAPQAQELRRRLEERFAARVKEELGLTDQQTLQLRQVAQDYAQRRRGLEADERLLKSALAAQLRPGVAANNDSVARLTQKLLDLKVTYARTYSDENRELGFLTPVQRAQLLVLRERMLQAFRQAREGAAEGAADRPLLRRRLGRNF